MKKKVLVLHTGGTLGMAPCEPLAAGAAGDGSEGAPRRRLPLAPDRYGQELLAQVPELARLATVETRILCNLDSSDIGPEEWTSLCEEVATARTEADGVVIVHGTDTMAYTASALSFALVGLDRPVILTGSQRPLGEVRTDARRNLVDAVDLATRDVPEVGICFDGRLLRGNRATKGDAWSYSAFGSPMLPPLARLGLDVEVAPHVRRPVAGTGFSLAPDFDARVALAWVTPGMDPRQLLRIVDGGETHGLVIAAFGVGNVPLRARSLAPAVAEVVRSGVTVVVVTQARAGAVDLGHYQNGAALADAGALSGGDMTTEAAVVKLMHALALHPGQTVAAVQARTDYLLRDVAGERGAQALHLVD